MVILIGCSTGTKKSQSINPAIDDPDFINIENSDFNVVEKFKFDPSTDYVKSEEIDSKSRIYQESLMADSKHKEIDSKDFSVSDPVSSLSVECSKREQLDEKSVDVLFEKHRNDPAYWNQIGLCHVLKNEFRQAQLYFNEALSLKKDYVPSLNNIGIIKLRKDDDQAAFAYFKRAGQISPRAIVPKLNMSLILLQYGHAQSVVNLLHPIQNDFGDSATLKLVYASALSGVKNDDLAIRVFEGVGKSELHKTAFAINYAMSLKRTGQKDKAMDIIKEIRGEVSIDPAFEKYLME